MKSDKQKPVQLFGIDWLSVYCSGTPVNVGKFRIVKQDYSTRQFKSVYNLLYDNDHFAMLVAEPHSTILDKTGMIIKVVNKYLYTNRAVNILALYLQQAYIKYRSISRLDLFSDFNYFTPFENPHQFIEDFFAGKVLKKGRSKFSAHGKTATKLEFQYLRFGTRESSSFIYLYNKTDELREASDKKYITDWWKLNGIDTTIPVWRLEYSFKPNRRGSLFPGTGEYEILQLSDLNDLKKLTAIWFNAVDQFFTFVRNDGQKNISRMTPIVLFTNNFEHQKLTYIPENPDDTQQAKRLLTQLLKHRELAFDHLALMKPSLDETIRNIVSLYNLQDWLRKKYQMTEFL